APFGLQRRGPTRPPMVQGFDPFDQIYADGELWLQKGWCDYFTPQLYWKTTATSQPYQPLLEAWTQENPHGRHIYGGLATYRIGEEPRPPATQPTSGPTTRRGRGGGTRGGAATRPLTPEERARLIW